MDSLEHLIQFPRLMAGSKMSGFNAGAEPAIVASRHGLRQASKGFARSDMRISRKHPDYKRPSAVSVIALAIFISVHSCHGKLSFIFASSTS